MVLGQRAPLGGTDGPMVTEIRRSRPILDPPPLRQRRHEGGDVVLVVVRRQ